MKPKVVDGGSLEHGKIADEGAVDRPVRVGKGPGKHEPETGEPTAFPYLAARINRHTISQDLVAALTGAIVVLPQGVAFATIAGMPPEYGLYAGMVPAIVAALFGSSWHLVSGPTTAASIVLLSSLSAFAEPGSAEYVRLALTLTLMVGAIQLFMGFARLGTLSISSLTRSWSALQPGLRY